MHELFEAQAGRTRERAAIRVGEMSLSYAQLDARANRLARVLRARGAGRGQRVGLCVERGADMLAAVLGVLKAGAAYVPLDPSFPQERLRFMAEDAQLALLVSTSALAGPLGLPRERQVLLDSDAAVLASQPDQRPSPDVALDACPEDPAYVIYTSGSTGKPKGVVVPHRAVVNFLTSMAREPGLSADDVLVAVTTLSFDIAVLELQLPLTLGATVVIASREQAMDGRALRGLLEERRATVMQATPVTWRLLIEAGWKGGKGFKALVGGEALPRDLADQLLARDVELWNMYGPTETTVWSTCAHITDTSNGISIGKPIANTTAYILDEQRNLCPIGMAGELCIGGDGVTLGYWNRPELTAERFIPDPFSTAPGATLYRTGDLACYRPDGSIDCLGRLDSQIKLRGHRIEPGEIEAALSRIEGVRQAAVLMRENRPGDKRLVAYYTGRDGLLPDVLRQTLAATLPDYMLPSTFQRLEQFPMTPNGKLDRKALPDSSAGERGSSTVTHSAPSNDLEISLARVWERVLGVQQVGITDNFFELGGNSLTAVRLISEMEQATGIEIGLGEIFHSPTIAALVTAMGADAKRNASVVVPLQPEGDGVPVFCICGIEIYRDFARSLGKTQPVFGIYVEEEQAIVNEVIRGEGVSLSIEQLVDSYCKAIARFRPHGPYRLAGLSFGGILAMEVASTLRKRGNDVELVFLLDTMLPEARHRNWHRLLVYQAADAIGGKGIRHKMRKLLAGLRGESVTRRESSLVPVGVKQSKKSFSSIREAAFFRAAERWSGNKLLSDFKVILFRASDRSTWEPYTDFDEDGGWHRYVGGRLCVFNAIGSHLGIIDPPNVAELGRNAQQCLACGLRERKGQPDDTCRAVRKGEIHMAEVRP